MSEIRTFDDTLVSVITPVYNAERFIAKAIDSVLAQTYPSIELILIDDCSRDSSAEIIKGYVEKHPNVIYRLQEKNMGAAVARNSALELARGRYVAFLDSDDVWLPEKTERQLELMKRTSSPLSYTAIEMIGEDDSLIKPHRKVKESIDYRFLLRNTMIATSSVIADRAILSDFRMPIRRSGQDYATWLMLLRGNKVACGINDALVRYRISSNSLSSNKFKSIEQVYRIQTRDEGIGKLAAAFNVLCFCFNAFKKYFM